jgi:hypothetical protein
VKNRDELAKQEVDAVSIELDKRLRQRFEQVVGLMARAPDQSFPEACGEDDAALEGTYRFFSNESVDHETLLASHYEKTLSRMLAESQPVLVVHDTTEFRFDGAREGMGRLQTGQGFLGHFALAVSGDGQRRALGAIGFVPVFRAQAKVTAHWRKRYRDKDKESLRWSKLVDQVGERAQAARPLIHVMDREGDSFELLQVILKQGARLVIRVRAEHRRTEDGMRVGEAAWGQPIIAEREVALSPRKARYMTKGKCKASPRPARTSRTAKLQIRACAVAIRPPDRVPGESLQLNLVHVTESDPPPSQEPMDWKLYTTEPISTASEVLAIVDHYRSRWVIEEYFKALKTGCAYERRQLGSRRALLNALATFVPIAWTLLVLRQECRSALPISTALTSSQLQVLRATLRKPLPAQPSARDLLLAIAALGGHIKHNGDPGWQVLGRGLQRLLCYEVGWNAASATDQS